MEQLWKDTAVKFEHRSNSPHCLGAIDGKHIHITKLTRTGSQHFNYKHYFSIVLLVVVDSNYKFIYIVYIYLYSSLEKTRILLFLTILHYRIL